MNVSLSLTFAANTHTAIVSSFSQSRPKFILPWKLESEDEASLSSSVPDGAAIGCEDGSLYFFRSSDSNSSHRRISTEISKSASSPDISILVEPLSPLRAPHLQSSRRSLSPSSAKSTISPFQPSKSRVVSSVSAEQAEAPKNYVDFEDEQAKLKGMVKRRGVKDKTVVDSLLSGTEKTLPDGCNEAASTPGTPSVVEGTVEAKSKALPSMNASRSSSVSLSSSPSPKALPSHTQYDESDPFPWSLLCHTVSSLSGVGGTIRDMKPLVHHGMLLCLHESGHIEAYSVEDGSCLAAAHVEEGGHFSPPSGTKAHSKLPHVWTWEHIRIVPSGQTHLIFAVASPFATSSAVQPFDSSDNDKEDETRIVAFELRIVRQGDPEGVKLSKAGDWSLNCSAGSIDLCQDINRDHLLVHVDPAHHLIRRTVTLADGPSAPQGLPTSSSSSNLPLPNPFKVLKALKSSENLASKSTDDGTNHIQLGNTLDLGPISLTGPICSIQIVKHGDSLRGFGWTNTEVCLFEIINFAVRSLTTISVTNVRDVRWLQEDTVTILQAGRSEVYQLTRVDANNNPLNQTEVQNGYLLQPRLVRSISLPSSDTCILSAAGNLLSTTIRSGRRRLYHHVIHGEIQPAPHLLWKARREDFQQDTAIPRVTSMLPIELDHIILAFSDGHIARSSLADLVKHGAVKPSNHISDTPLAGPVTGMFVVQNERTGERRILGGSDDGSIAIWSLDTLQLLARWIVFLEPLAEVIYLSSGRLKGCAFCISRDGTLALIAVDGCQFLHLVPAAAASLKRLCLGEDNLLLCYADGRARLWDIKTREFWRSMSTDKADEILKQGGWSEWSVGSKSSSSSVLTGIPGAYAIPDAASTLSLDLEAFLLQVGAGTVSPSAQPAEFLNSAATSARCDNIRAVLSAILTFSLNEEIDRLCRETLHIHRSNVSVGISSHGATTMYIERGKKGPWLISPDVSAARASAIVSLLQALLHYEENSNDARTVTVFYTASLAQVVGPSYKAPNLAVLALQWLQAKAPELKNASRLRFEAGVVRLMDDEVVQLVESWQNGLPSLQEPSCRDSTQSAMSLFICGTVAIERYTLLQTGCLTDIAKSIALYLHDELSPHRALAIDLCSRGFPVWQQYVDAVEILRALFTLATSTRKEAISTHNVGQQARSAVLQIASSNTPLFMTTLSIDILQPKSVQHRKSVMQLVIFLIHKKPLALYSNLPRLVEAVVKSLDPNSTASREAVLDSATEILGHIVDTYPIVDFHGPTQRLAVGTSEGAVVMYDLKTATRLYVLEGHKKRTTACSFSPDGRRLMTLSLDESTVLVWKVGSSFVSFFLPGAPPRQGHAGSEPYKTLDFNIGDEAVMTVAESLELVRFDWVNDRSVKLHIRNATLTFST